MMKNIVFGCCLIISISFVSCQKSAENSASDENDDQALPEKLVDRIQLLDLEGNDVPLSNFKGKTVFLNYWATWCRPCLAEMPDIDNAYKALEDENFVFLAASDEELDKIKEFVAKFDYSFQIVQSKRSVFDLDIIALPTTMIIDKDGEIIYNEVGARDWASETELDNLRKLAEK